MAWKEGVLANNRGKRERVGTICGEKSPDKHSFKIVTTVQNQKE
jgi:hypothetical protein